MPHGVPAAGNNGRDDRRTNDWIAEDDEEGGIVDPLDLEAAPLIFKFGEGSLDVSCLELGRETREREDAGNAGGERHGQYRPVRTSQRYLRWNKETYRILVASLRKYSFLCVATRVILRREE